MLCSYIRENSFPLSRLLSGGSRAPNKSKVCLRSKGIFDNAKIAQLVERHLAKVEVAGSNPVFRSEEMLFTSIFLLKPSFAKATEDKLEWWNW